jgi:hypothetical protein
MDQTEAVLRSQFPKCNKSFLRGEMGRLESVLLPNEELDVGIGGVFRLYITTHHLIVSSDELLALRREAIESIGVGDLTSTWKALRGVPPPVKVLTKSGRQYNADSVKGQSTEEFVRYANGWLFGTA